MSVSTAFSQHNRPDMLVVALIHQSLRIDAARLASALATVGPGDRPGRVAAIGAFYGQYRGQLAPHHRHEDELFFPVLAATTRKATPLNRARFMIPWLVTHASQDQRTALSRSIPPLRLFYWLTVLYHRRFDRALAGAAGRPGVAQDKPASTRR